MIGKQAAASKVERCSKNDRSVIRSLPDFVILREAGKFATRTSCEVEGSLSRE